MTVPTEAAVTRRQILVAGGTFAGYALGVEKVLAQAITTDTQGLVAGDQQVPVGGVNVPVYEARPASGKDHPIVLVISEIWGVHEYIKDTTRRFAKAGFYAVAPELFVREGGVGQLTNTQEILKIVLSQKREQTLGDIKATIDWAKTRPNVKSRAVGVTGFCWGGGVTVHVAATNPDVKAAVPWYGSLSRPMQAASGPVTGFDVAKDIKIPLLALCGETDKNPSPEDARKFGEMVKHHNPNVEIVVYPGAGHAFHADYRPSYNKAAADDGWNRCVAWFNKYLKA
jgi:carboxymethylenebutenolidase